LPTFPFWIGALHTKRIRICAYGVIRVKMKAMAVPDNMSLTELEDLAAKLRHTTARNGGHLGMEKD
jgi:hypothetical protein